MPIATHVTIDGTHTYKLGQTSSQDTDIQCIAADGIVHRVCHWQPSGIQAGTRLKTSGSDMHYHMGDDGRTFTECDECGASIPDDEPSEVNKYHQTSCSLHPEA